MGLFSVCTGTLNEGQVIDESCTSWSKHADGSYAWVLDFVFAFYLLAGVSMIFALVIKLLWDSLRGIAATLYVNIQSNLFFQSILI